MDHERRPEFQTSAATDPIPICLLPGMTPDYPVYSRMLPLLPDAQVMEFAEPNPNESLVEYAGRMANRLPSRCFIGGVSFGGILALEIARLIQPAGCILIASIRKPAELPPWLRAWRLIGRRQRSGVLNLVGRAAATIPRKIRTPSTLRLTKLAGQEGTWHRWATSAVMDWSPLPPPVSCPVLHIHGDADTTFPVRYTSPDVVIQGGRHALPMSHPVETADAIQAFVRTV